MRSYIFIVLFINLFASTLNCIAAEDTSILHDTCINELYQPAAEIFKNSDIYVIRDSRGLILRFALDNPLLEYGKLSIKTLNRLEEINSFLAKIKNPAIIEVHSSVTKTKTSVQTANWEITTVIANEIESSLCELSDDLKNRIHSVGYGEFLPAKNTPNNGGKLQNRVDIIILCNISGE